MLSLGASSLSFAPGVPLAVQAPRACAGVHISCTAETGATSRRDMLAGLAGVGALLSLPSASLAQVESTNPANNYYFPMAKYRYLPRIFRAWVAVDELAPVALEVGDWEGMTEVVRRADDAITALPLYTNAVEGSRSGKRKKKSETQKVMTKDLAVYDKAIKALDAATLRKDVPKAQAALVDARSSLLSYRQLAKIDTPDGGVIAMPLGNAEESGHAGAPLGYVVPAFRGGGVSMDYALRAGEPMMEGGMVSKAYREKYANGVEAAKAKKK